MSFHWAVCLHHHQSINVQFTLSSLECFCPVLVFIRDTFVVVPGRNWTLIHCIFWLCYHIRSTACSTEFPLRTELIQATCTHVNRLIKCILRVWTLPLIYITLYMVEIRNELMFDFYPRLPHLWIQRLLLCDDRKSWMIFVTNGARAILLPHHTKYFCSYFRLTRGNHLWFLHRTATYGIPAQWCKLADIAV